MGDQSVGGPLPTQDNTDIEKAQTYVCALSGIRIHDPSVQVGKDISCLKTTWPL
jgi:hypothetical protein